MGYLKLITILGHSLLLLILLTPSCFSAKLRVGVVGGGLGGAAVSYFLRETYGDQVDITIFEGESIGGRLATVKVGELEYENGGAIIHPLNKYAIDLATHLGLEIQDQNHHEVLALYKDKHVIYSGSKWRLIDYAKLIWRYGLLNLYNINQALNKIMSSFQSIYELQDKGVSFGSVHDMMNAISPELNEYSNITTFDGFRSLGASESFVNEIIQATLRVNYGQNVNAPMFVGAVSLAGGEATLSIKGGNKLLVESLINVSKASIINEPVKGIKNDNGKGYYISTLTKKDIFFDVTVIATPLSIDHKYKVAFDKNLSSATMNGKYKQTVCTIVKGTINGTSFENDVDIVVSLDQDDFFNSVGLIHSVDGKKETDRDVWKVFSHLPLTSEEYSILFSNYEVISETRWLAYPHYTIGRGDDSFILNDKMYYINAVEWAASAMEMVLIGAKNVGLLIKRDLGNNFLSSTFETLPKKIHDEM